MVGGTAQPFHPIGDSNTDAFQSLCLHTFSGQHPDATGIARDSLSLTGPSLLSRAAHCNCAHTFYLSAWKRTIDGYNYLINGTAHQSITINNTGVACPL